MKAILLSVVLALTSQAAESPFGQLYDEATLKKWQSSFEEDLVWNFRNAILPALTRDEKRALSGVKIEVPLRGKNEGLFEFYADGEKVVMPALALRFFGDLSMAYAWLNKNNYNVGTVQQYVGMLTYRPAKDFSGSRYPRPYDALQIPSNARDDASVLNTMEETFTQAMIFILCHELGHIYYHHPGYIGISMSEARANETEADKFAIEVMRRLHKVPAGAMFWFATATCAERHRASFATDEQYQEDLRDRTHPLTAERIEALAAAIDEAAPDFALGYRDPTKGLVQTHYVASEVRKIGQVLRDEDVHGLFRQQSMTTEVKMLAPRRETAFTAAASAESFPNEAFSGIFRSAYSSYQSGEAIDLWLILRRKGDRVTGDYTYGVRAGRVSGVVLRGKLLKLEWTEGSSSGKATMVWGGDDKSFAGVWGNGDSEVNGGVWSGKRE